MPPGFSSACDSGAVVGQRRVGLVTRNRREALADEAGLLCAQFAQFRIDVEFGDRFAARQRPLDPARAAHQRHAIAAHRFAHVRQLGFVLARLGGGNRVGRFDQNDAIGNRVRERSGNLHGCEQQSRIAGQLAERIADGFVMRQPYTIGLQSPPQIRVEFRGIDEQPRAITVDQQMRQEYRVVLDVAAAQVQHPGDFIQRGNEVMRGAGFAHRVTCRRELFRAGANRVFERMLPHRRVRQRRAVAPDTRWQVFFDQLHAAPLQLLAQGPPGCQRQHLCRTGDALALSDALT